MAKIYIASSWKHQHGVEMLTKALREQGHFVFSWIENNYNENPDAFGNQKKFDFETWVNGSESDKSFEYDSNGAMQCDLFIYYGPAGKDAAAECGMAFAKNTPMVAISAKGEDFGLMRKMFMRWFSRITELLRFTASLKHHNYEKEVSHE